MVERDSIDKGGTLCYNQTVNRGRHPLQKTEFTANLIQGGDTHRKKRDCSR